MSGSELLHAKAVANAPCKPWRDHDAVGMETDLVTGAFSYSGARIAELLIESGRGVRTLTHHPNRDHPLSGEVHAAAHRFDDPDALARSLRRMRFFPLSGYGRYLVQPVHVDDFARICTAAAHGPPGAVDDAAGPDTLSFEDLVHAVRDALGSRSPVLHAPPAAMAA